MFDCLKNAKGYFFKRASRQRFASVELTSPYCNTTEHLVEPDSDDEVDSPKLDADIRRSYEHILKYEYNIL